MSKYIIEDAYKAKKRSNAEEWISEYTDDWEAFVVNTETGLIVFADGGADSPEDNNLSRHFGGLVDLLNEEAAQ